MRIVLDECLPKRLGRELAGHEVTTVQQAGLAGVKNGELLRRLAGNFDAFLTVDRNLPSQQRVSTCPFGVVILRAPSNRIEDLRPLVPALLSALGSLQAGEVAYAQTARD